MTLVPNIRALEIEETEMKEKGLGALTKTNNPPVVQSYPTIFKVTTRGGGENTMTFYDPTAIRSPQAVKKWLLQR